MIDWESEDVIKQKLAILAAHSNYFMQVIVNDDNDDTYIPDFDFEYMVCDCEENWELLKWKKFFDIDTPIVFINTSKMFEKIEIDANKRIQEGNANRLYNIHGEPLDGAGIWISNFYFNYRDKLWLDSNAKFIFLLKDEDLTSMWNAVNNGMTIELIPYYFKKNKKVKELAFRENKKD